MVLVVLVVLVVLIVVVVSCSAILKYEQASMPVQHRASLASRSNESRVTDIVFSDTGGHWVVIIGMPSDYGDISARVRPLEELQHYKCGTLRGELDSSTPRVFGGFWSRVCLGEVSQESPKNPEKSGKIGLGRAYYGPSKGLATLWGPPEGWRSPWWRSLVEIPVVEIPGGDPGGCWASNLILTAVGLPT